MVSIFDVANWFVLKEPMTHKKIQKLCYYAEAWYIALYDKRLFNESEFEAWVHGPVSRELYNSLKDTKCNLIKEVEPFNDKADLSGVDIFLERVWMTYGDMSANALESLSHNEPPWKNARTGLGELQKSAKKIKFKDMQKYYRSILDK